MTVISLLSLLVVIPSIVGLTLFNECFGGDANPLRPHFWRNLFRAHLEPGDFLIYRKPKLSSSPGPRARNVRPADSGPAFSYEVDKFWTVRDILEDGRLIAVTRTGKQLFITPEDDRLRKARLFERLRYRGRFPSAEAA